MALWCARITLLVVLCAAPWFYGGVELDTQVWLNRGLLASLAFWAVASWTATSTDSTNAARLPTLLAPLVGALVLGALQLVPDTSINGQGDAALQSDIRVDSASGARALIPAEHPAHSIYPAATRLEIARLGLAVVACYLGIVLFGDSGSQVCLWSTFAVNGAAISFFGIVQQLSWNGKLFWTVPLLLGGQPFASFVNRNNAAGYLNICLAGALGLTIWSFVRSARSKQGQAHRSNGITGPGKSRRVSMINEITVTSVVLTSTIAAGIICSVSRGGLLALLFAAFATFLCTYRTRVGTVIGTCFIGVLVLGVSLVFWTGQQERFLVRWNSSSGDTIESGAQTRLANWRDALQAAHDFPALGTGLGTYSFAYLPYQSWAAPVRFYNADNQFVECLVEGGACGLGLVLISIVLWLLAAQYLIRFDQLPACGIVGLFTIASQVVSASFDFGPTMSANMLALAVLAGATTGRAATIAWHVSPLRPSRWFLLADLPSARTSLAIAVVLLGYGLIQLKEIEAAAACRVALRDVPRRLDLADAMTPASLESSIQNLAASLQSRPDDAEAHAMVAKLLILRYRQQTYNELVGLHQKGGPVATWAMTDMLVLYNRCNEWRNDKQQATLNELRGLPVVQDNLAPAYQHLLAARVASPLMPGLDIGIATLAMILEDNETVARSAIQRAVALAPADPEFIQWCSRLAESGGLTDVARDCNNRIQALQSRRTMARID